eukprot:COSAG01_NODE_239_length_20670_cov_28.609790_2_plen_256_part_00
MLFYAQKLPKKDLFAHASQYCTYAAPSARCDAPAGRTPGCGRPAGCWGNGGAQTGSQATPRTSESPPNANAFALSSGCYRARLHGGVGECHERYLVGVRGLLTPHTVSMSEPAPEPSAEEGVPPDARRAELCAMKLGALKAICQSSGVAKDAVAEAVDEAEGDPREPLVVLILEVEAKRQAGGAASETLGKAQLVPVLASMSNGPSQPESMLGGAVVQALLHRTPTTSPPWPVRCLCLRRTVESYGERTSASRSS